MTTARTIISLRVSVPVLSVQIVVVDPSVSTDDSLRTITFRFAIRWVPSDSTTVVIAVRPSGTAATASDTASSSTSTTSVSVRSSSSTRIVALMTSAMAITAMPSSLPTRSSSFCSGVAALSADSSDRAIFPISVAAPVAVTIARPRPAAIEVPLKTMFTWSPTPASPSSAPRDFDTGVLSPVRADSAARSAIDSSTRASAAIVSPSSRSRTSPGTSSAVGVIRCSPSRRTRAFGADIATSAASACSARLSWMKPSAAFSSTIARMVIASYGIGLSRSIHQATRETTVASSRSRVRTSRNCARKRRQAGSGAAAGSSFLPCSTSRGSTSADERPRWASEPSAATTSAAPRR